ncbi:hypothetical protein GCM10018775_63080 [Streptomyces umbrinus]|nr:hypothetical protein GCM10018775_63080 [Streptomyces umbrinus]
MQIASMSAMNVVPRMNPSTARYARRAIASVMSPEPRGTSERRVSAARCESRRKKKTSSSARTAMAMAWPTTLIPLITPDAAVPPNLPSSSLALEARSSSEVPAAPKCSDSDSAACLSEAVISSPVSISAATTMYVAPPTTASTAAQVTPAAIDRFTFARTSRPYSGRSSAVPSSASSTGTTAVLNSTHSRTPTTTTPVTSRATTHQAATRRTGSGRSRADSGSRGCTPPPDHASVGAALREG